MSRCRCALEDCLVHNRGRRAFECASTRRHFVKHKPERKQIRAGIQMLSADLLGRHVAGGSDRSSGDRQSRVVGRAIEAFVSWRVPQRIGCGILSFHNRRLLIFLCCGQFRQAEVEDLDRSMVRKKYVRGLDISMAISRTVGKGSGSGKRASCAESELPSSNSITMKGLCSYSSIP